MEERFAQRNANYKSSHQVPSFKNKLENSRREKRDKLVLMKRIRVLQNDEEIIGEKSPDEIKEIILNIKVSLFLTEKKMLLLKCINIYL
jgi:hypothetical protein